MPESHFLTLKQGGGWLALFGAPFLIAGVCLLFVKSDAGIGERLYGLGFTLVGAGFVFGRRGVTIDRKRNTITKWTGMLGLKWSDFQPLKNFSYVTINQEITEDTESRQIRYPVSLSGDGERYEIGDPTKYPLARKWAKSLSEFLDIEIRDFSKPFPEGMGALITDDASEIFREYFKGGGKIPPAPGDLRVQNEGRRLLIEIPPAGWGKAQTIAVAATLVALSCFYFLVVLEPRFAKEPNEPLRIGMSTVLYFLIPTGLVLLPCAYTSTRSYVMEVSPTEVEVRKRSCFAGRTRRLAISEIEEVEIGDMSRSGKVGHFSSEPPLALILYGKEKPLPVGLNRPYRELKFLQTLLTTLMKGQSVTGNE